MHITKSEISKIFKGRLSLLLSDAGISRKNIAETLNCSLSSVESKLTPNGQRHFSPEELIIIESKYSLGIFNILREITCGYSADSVVSPVDSVVSPVDSVVSPADSVVSPVDSVVLHFPDIRLRSVLNDDSVQASILNLTRLKEISSEERRKNCLQDVLLAIEESGKINDRE